MKTRHELKSNHTLFDFKQKRVLVMGLGLHGGGVGTVRFLALAGARVTVTDLRNKKMLQPSLERLADLKAVTYILGAHRENDFLKSDLIVKNPGVPPTSPFLACARKHGIPITTDMGIFFRACPGTIIGITGTRGKSTTAWLIWKFLRTKYRRVFLGGNIRKSVLELLPKVRRDDLMVLELSSFQLQDIFPDRVSPHIAVLTNILPDHLNWHRSMEEYIRAKSIIFRFQKKDDYLFANPDDSRVRVLTRGAKSHVILPRLPLQFRKLVDDRLGAHYRNALALAIAVARHYGVPEEKIISVLGSFTGLEGRQQILGMIAGIHLVCDTTATIPDAAIAALQRFHRMKKKTARMILIAGGSDKNLDYTAYGKAIRRYADTVILLPGTATEKLKKYLADGSYTESVSMDEACKKAVASARRDDWILLSPGAASFGLFVNEFDRGKKFEDCMNQIKRKVKKLRHDSRR